MNKNGSVHSRYDRNRDLVGAAVCGFCTGAILGWSRTSGEAFSPEFMKCIVLGTASYSFAALLLLARRQPGVIHIPKWVLIPILGSVFSFVSNVLIPNEIERWRVSTELSFYSQGLLEKITNLGISVIFDNLIGLPLMALFHYYSHMTKRQSERLGSRL